MAIIAKSSSASNLEEEPEDTDENYSHDEQPRTFSFFDDNSSNETNNKGQQRVLIHCHAGISRSVTIAAAYLMRKKRQNIEETMQMIKRARPVARPNDGFMQQLQLWWDVRFQLFRIPEFRVPCEEYEELRRRLVLRG